MTLLVRADGCVEAIYDEQIDLGEIGRVVIARASHVEPDSAGRWWADMSPVAGPALGPFGRRGQALAAERVWLEENRLAGSRGDQARPPSGPCHPR